MQKPVIIPGKVDRKRWIRLNVEYFRDKYPEQYQSFVDANRRKKLTRANKYGAQVNSHGTIDFDEGWREGVTIPEMVLTMINAWVPDPDDHMKMKPVIEPPFLQGGREGTAAYQFARKELNWFMKTYPEFATAEKI